MNLVDHTEYGANNITNAVFTLNKQVLFCEYASDSAWEYDEADKRPRLSSA